MGLGKCEKTQAANVCEFEYLHVECPSHSLPPLLNDKRMYGMATVTAILLVSSVVKLLQFFVEPDSIGISLRPRFMCYLTFVIRSHRV